MASTPPHCHVATSKSYQNQRCPTRSPHVHHHVAASKTPLQNPPLSSSSSALSPAVPLQSFSGRRSTRLVSKFHVPRPKASTSSSRHSLYADDTLLSILRSDNVHGTLASSALTSFEDHSFVIKELAVRKQFAKVISCYRFFLSKQTSLIDRGKLATSVISALGRNGNHQLAREIFEEGLQSGFGKTVFAFSALISAYGKCRDADEALSVFNSMKGYSIKPNLVVYNALIDALGKSGSEFARVAEVFDEMVANGVQPDRITFNSLLAVCSRGGLWEAARDLFSEMEKRGIVQDIFSYNTLLDAICKGGQMDLAFDVMSEMPLRNIFPNVVTYSTVIDGYAKAGRLEEGLALFEEMKCLGIGLDRVSFNTLLSIYAKLGRFEEALEICKEMESSGIEKDVVTYNALLGGYGKQFKYDEVKRVFQEMKRNKVLPNLLTYSTLIDVYSKGGLYQEAMKIFSEFKQAGLKPDVVLYSALIDALCKNGLVESAVSLLDEMTKEGIRPNVVTYNSIIDAFGRNVSGSQIAKMCEQLGKLGEKRGKQEIRCIIGVFHKMHELEIKPNVVTFSAILNACSRCDSFEDASMLLEELRLFDDKVYGVAHGLLTGGDEVWEQALRLFDEVKLMDFSTASAFYNALTDMLWHFGQKKGAQLVVLEGKRRQLWENMWTDSCLDLHLMSSGAACAMVHAWLLNIRSIVFDGRELPKLLSILTGWGKHSKVVGDSSLRRNVEALLNGMGAPFQLAKCNLGRFICNGAVVGAWLRDAGTLNLLVLNNDRRRKMEAVGL